MAPEPIRIQGLAEFQRKIGRLDSDLPKAMRLAMNKSADVVISYAKPRVPTRTGRARRSIRPRSTRTSVRVFGGSKRVSYYPWLDFGGKVGPKQSVVRPFFKEGRYLWKALAVKRAELTRVLTDSIVQTARQAGIEVD